MPRTYPGRVEAIQRTSEPRKRPTGHSVRHGVRLSGIAALMFVRFYAASA
jgi:hypothetical protein